MITWTYCDKCGRVAEVLPDGTVMCQWCLMAAEEEGR